MTGSDTIALSAGSRERVVGLYGNDFDPTREWELRRLQMMLQRQPEVARAPEPHGISYWCWVVVDALANALALLLAGALFVLPLVLLERADRFGVVLVALTLCGLLVGIAALVWLSVSLKERRILRLAASIIGELALIGGLAAVLVMTM